MGSLNAGNGTAVDIDTTALDVALTSVTSAGGTLPGIDLNTTAGNFTITGDGVDGAVTGGDGSGGTIGAKTGADSVPPTAGAGVVLNDAQGVVLTSMLLRDFTNWGIYGQTVNGLDLLRCRIDSTGTNGTNTLSNEGSVLINDLTGTSAITRSVIEDGLTDNLRIDNSTGTLNPLNVTNTTFGLNSTASGNDAFLLQGTGTASITATIDTCTFNGARGDMFQSNTTGSAAMNVTLENSTLINTHPNIAPAGGGVTISGGSVGGTEMVTYNVSNNLIRGTAATPVLGNLLLANFLDGNGTASGLIDMNALGDGAIGGSGTVAAALGVQAEAGVTHSVIVSNNTIRESGDQGFGAVEVIANQSGTMNVQLTGNDVLLDAGTSGLSAVYTAVGGAGLTGTLCLQVDNNTFNSTPNAGAFAAIFIDQAIGGANYNFPSYTVPPLVSASLNGEFGSGFGAPCVNGTANADLTVYFAGRGNTFNGGQDATIICGATNVGASCP